MPDRASSSPRRAACLTLGAALALLACERTLDLGVDDADGGGLDGSVLGGGGPGSEDGAPSGGDGGSSRDGATADRLGPPGDGDGGGPGYYAFVTRGTYAGDLGGIAGADFRCQSSATAAGLPGTYIAWISDDSVNAGDRVTANGPWREVGTEAVLFPDRAAWRGYPNAPLARDETGQKAPTRWWTGTAVNGLRHTKTCAGWTSRDQFQGGMTGIFKAVPDGGRPGKEWTEEAAFSCVFDNDLQRYALVCLRN